MLSGLLLGMIPVHALPLLQASNGAAASHPGELHGVRASGAELEQPSAVMGPRQMHSIVREWDVVQNLDNMVYRYFTVLQVPRGSPFAASLAETTPEPELWVFARTGTPPHANAPSKVVMWANVSTDGPLVPSTAISPQRPVRDPSVSHNFAALFTGDGHFLCGGGEYRGRDILPARELRRLAATRPDLVAHGIPEFLERLRRIGRKRMQYRTGVIFRRAERRDQVVVPPRRRLSTSAWTGLEHAGSILGSHPGCVEARSKNFTYDPSTGRNSCEFDGRISLVEHRGQLFAYFRANVSNRKSHGRYVQVVHAPGPEGPWSPFELVHIPEWPVEAGNIYFAAVNRNPADPETLLALLPANDGQGRAFVGLAVSVDGVHFSPMHELISSFAAPAGRTTDHPVDGIVVRDGMAYFWIHQNVPGVCDATDAAPDARVEVKCDGPQIVRLGVSLDKLAELTTRLKARLDAHDHVGSVTVLSSDA